ncbi:DinB family protein [Spirosoma pollinicola]|uniref:DinB family protein n=1 Tax=Spirosoma pollinicola TaxID=2057025 RepID=A0A2K8YWA5_9BACT|nr:DinB family protein [Spirosoma pollinicola]AUD01911.1 DinB family protein [Spirosoma pollinicola]
MQRYHTLCLLWLLTSPLLAQTTSLAKLWTETDRQYTLDNLRRTRDLIVQETQNLTPAQWKFKESPDRWNIGEIVEHLALWEIIWAREVSMGSRSKPQPELNQTSKPDSFYATWIMEDSPHVSPDFSRPTGFIEGKNNLAFFLKLREQTIAFVGKTGADMRAQFELAGTDSPRNMHQVYIFQWGHVDRHLRQIRKVKADSGYPTSSH